MNDMMQMFGQMMCWPMTAFADAMSRSMQSMQGMGMPGMSWGAQQGNSSCAPCSTAIEVRQEPVAVSTQSCRDDWGCGSSGNDWSCPSSSGRDWSCNTGSCGCGCNCSSCSRGNCCGGSNCHHSGSNQVKLVEYSVVNIGRGAGNQNLRCRQMLIRDCTTAEEFNNCVIAEYAKEHPHVDCKNLRVYYKVLDCWCKQDWDYEARQIEVLEEIRNAIARKDRREDAEKN
jgi:hypothetical protein